MSKKKNDITKYQLYKNRFTEENEKLGREYMNSENDALSLKKCTPRTSMQPTRFLKSRLQLHRTRMTRPNDQTGLVIRLPCFRFRSKML